MLSAGGFPTQVVIRDLKGQRMVRGFVLSEGHKVGLHSMPSDHGAATVHALSPQHEIQLLDFAKGDRIPQDTSVFQRYTCRD